MSTPKAQEQIYVECGVCGHGLIQGEPWLVDNTDRNLALIQKKKMRCPRCQMNRVRVSKNPEEQGALRDGEKDARIAALNAENRRLHELLKAKGVKPAVVSQAEAAEQARKESQGHTDGAAEPSGDEPRPPKGKTLAPVAGRRS